MEMREVQASTGEIHFTGEMQMEKVYRPPKWTMVCGLEVARKLKNYDTSNLMMNDE